jgi:hypothetical protein
MPQRADARLSGWGMNVYGRHLWRANRQAAKLRLSLNDDGQRAEKGEARADGLGRRAAMASNRLSADTIQNGQFVPDANTEHAEVLGFGHANSFVAVVPTTFTDTHRETPLARPMSQRAPIRGSESAARRVICSPSPVGRAAWNRLPKYQTARAGLLFYAGEQHAPPTSVACRQRRYARDGGGRPRMGASSAGARQKLTLRLDCKWPR